MMKLIQKIAFLFMVIALAPQVAFSQKVQMGQEYESNARNNKPVLLGIKDGIFYVVRVTGYGNSIYMNLFRSDGKATMGAMILGFSKFSNDAPFNEEKIYYTDNCHYFFEKYDQNLKQISSKELDVEFNAKKDIFDFVKFGMLGNQLFAISYKFDEGKSENILQYHTITDDGDINKSPTVISSYTTTNKYNKGLRDNSFRVLLSPDNKKMAIINAELEFPKNTTGTKSIEIQLFNEKAEEISKERFDLPITEKNVKLEKLKLSNTGDLAALFKKETEDKKKDGPDAEYTLFTYLNSTKKLEEFAVKLEGKYTNDINFEFDDYNNLQVAGFFSGTNKSSAEGYFYQSINTSNANKQKEAEAAFTEDFIVAAVGEKKAKKTDELKNFHMRKIIPLKDGRTILIAEKYYIIYDDNDFRYNYEDMYVIMLDKTGEYEWVQKVLKYQLTINDGGLYCSFCSIANENEVILIYNANRDDPDDRMTNTNKATAYQTTVPLDGSKPKTKKLFNAKELETIMVPKIFIQESEESLLLYNISGRFYKYGRVKI